MTNNVHLQAAQDQIQAKLDEARRACVKIFGKAALAYSASLGPECPAIFDQIACWPPTPAGSIAVQSCPAHVSGFDVSQNATRECMDDGTWYYDRDLQKYWTNYNSCRTSAQTTIYLNYTSTNISLYLQEFAPMIKIMSQSGYLLSSTTLIIAFGIMLLIKRLHCARNILHMHLFASFIFRALLSLAVSVSFYEGVGLPEDILEKNGSSYFHIVTETNNWSCKLIVSIEQYFLTANYSWIFMEGLYLHNLIFRALFAESTNSIKWYVIMGWGQPLLIILTWVKARLSLEDSYCWTTNGNFKVYLIIAGPIMFSILINMFLFIRISAVLFSKLRSPINEASRKYKKWFRSTLVLVPLFGVHYALFMILYFFIEENDFVELIWLAGDQFFGSFQGFFVAVLFCFLNGEVRAEIRPQFCYLLHFLATNKYTRLCFPCRKAFLKYRSGAGRSSVSTTMSCSSLYTTGIIRQSKGRLDACPKLRIAEKSKTHNALPRKNSGTLFPLHNMKNDNFIIEPQRSKSPLGECYNQETGKMILSNF